MEDNSNITNPPNYKQETRKHDEFNYRSDPNGRSTVDIRCPFCDQVTERISLWSLAGSGKKCACGAKHIYMGALTIAPKHKSQKDVLHD